MPSFYEFFAGGGMARAGLGDGWRCAFANDFDPTKAAIYASNWGSAHLNVGDIRMVTAAHLPDQADLAWASFPCQDLSLAGAYKGLSGERSGMFWPFWELMRELDRQRRAPKIITIENVYGALTASGGKDFGAIAAAFTKAKYRFGAMVIDARHFLPQSRPRFFLIGVRGDVDVPASLIAAGPSKLWHPSRLVSAYGHLPPSARKLWVWWNLPAPNAHTGTVSRIIEERPTLVEWHTPAQTARLLGMMSPLNREKVRQAQRTGCIHVGTIYRRTREGIQRAEVRFDEVAGCLRTPRGGSSRQTILIVQGDKIRSRLLSAREAARLMGLPDSYKLPGTYNDAYQLAGDGVAVPVVAHLAEHIFNPLLASNEVALPQAV